MTDICRICRAAGPHASHVAREMMFGYRERFRYFQCSSCGCLQLADVPDDMSRYYPPGYYSFGPPADSSTLEGFTRPLRVRFAMTGRGLLGRLLCRKFPYRFVDVHRWLARTGATRTSRILDVGCGSGELLQDLATWGYQNLTGVDPFLQGDVRMEQGPVLLKRTIHDLRGEFDLIMFHHALEHIPDQLETMRSCARLLAPGGYCLVRIPIASSFAWEHYREDWVQLDAPRHLFLHSRDSIERLGSEAGLRLAAVEYDGTEFQFIGSELYRLDIPLVGAGRHLSRRQVWRFRRLARKLNHQGRGDQAAFYFARPDPVPDAAG